MKQTLEQFWKNYSFIHIETKKLYILTEEYDDGLNSFIQPIKEQRDSLEHIVRAYNRIYTVTEINDDDEKYISTNLDKAIGHVFRAYFDCADVLSIIIRERLSTELRQFKYKEIIKAWPDYESFRIDLVKMPEKIAKLRRKKDVAKSSEKIMNMVKEYQSHINILINIYHKYMYDIYPILNK